MNHPRHTVEYAIQQLKMKNKDQIYSEQEAIKLSNENIKFGYLKRYYNGVFVIRHNDGFERNCYVTE